jgi:hypothetical protein
MRLDCKTCLLLWAEYGAALGSVRRKIRGSADKLKKAEAAIAGHDLQHHIPRTAAASALA